MAAKQKATTTTNATANTTVTLSPSAATLTSGGYVITNPNGPTYTYTGITGGGGGYGGGTGTGTVGIGSWSAQSSVDMAGVLQLNGKNADIKINDISLNETLKTIQERLNILVPNSKFENEWIELKKLGEQYRKLEAELEEKSRMWTALKKTE